MNCTNPTTIILQQQKDVKYQRHVRVGCGQCINCKQKRAQETTNRLVDESTTHKDVCIIVLTYDNEHIRYGEKTKYGRYGTLWHPDVQKFMKRLRKHIMLGRKNGTLSRDEHKLKYYIAGEYGEAKKRPHYHIALFGLNDRIPEHRNIIGKSWNLGNILYYQGNNELTAGGYAYVAQYIQKKIYDGKNAVYYTDRGICAPYNVGSKGLGKVIALKNREKFEEQGYRDWETDRKSTRLNSSHRSLSRMPSSA